MCITLIEQLDQNKGYPTTLNTVPNGDTRTFNGSGGTNAYSDGRDYIEISQGWDHVTRPPTFAVNLSSSQVRQLDGQNSRKLWIPDHG